MKKIIKQEYNNYRGYQQTLNRARSLSQTERTIIESIAKKGYCVIEQFYDTTHCNKIIQEIEKIDDKFRSKVHLVDDCDYRYFGANRVAPIIQNFFTNSFIDQIVKEHEGMSDIVGFTLAAKLKYKSNNKGSGNGWHRDRVRFKQTKAILYLSDVDESSGPFQFIEGSHLPLDFLKNIAFHSFGISQNRFDDDFLSHYLKKNKKKLKTFTGKAGTLIFVNTRGIHRGMPIKKGVRYALTNYYFQHKIPDKIESLAIVNS